MLIVIEGIDKAGKKTQTRMLEASLRRRRYRVATMAFPDYSTRIGREIRAFLNGKRDYPLAVKHMLLSANRWEKRAELEALLKQKGVVILNRYRQSNLAYGSANGLKLKWLEALDSGLPEADLVIVLDIEPKASIARMKKRGDAFETGAMMGRVRRLYRQLARRYGWAVVDADRSRKEVHGEIMSVVERKMASKRIKS